MKKLKTYLFLAFFLILLQPAYSDFNDGWIAYSSGNYKKAFEEWLPYAKQGDAQAQYNLAGLYVNGYGVDLDDKKAFEWYQKSAQQGFAKAQFNIGAMYLTSIGVEKSYSKAKHWLSLAYENGIEDSEVLWNKYELWNY
jgi:TPR repeat protein